MTNMVGKVAAACGVFALIMALWVNGDQFWKWFWSGMILLFVSLFVTAWYRQNEEKNRG